MVSDGTYYEHNILIDKPLTILGDPGDAAAGPGTNAPVIDGTGSEYPHDGFKIKNAVNHEIGRAHV